MALIGDVDGRLCVQRQVEDYAFRGDEFETMGFLTFTVEKYECRITKEINDEDEPSSHLTRNQHGRYLNDHSRSGTHLRVSQSQNHTALPNIVGCWLPRRDGEDCTKSFYYASLLAFLKPWRCLEDLKIGFENWESAFNQYMQNTNQ